MVRPAARLFMMALAMTLAACAPRENESGAVAGADQTTMQKAIATKRIRIGYANEAPFAYLDPASGKLTGEAPEIARVVLARMGVVEVQGVLTEFGALIPGLHAGRFDMIAAGMYVLPPRCKQIAFSNPTYGISDAFAVAAGNPRNIHSYQDIAANPDLKLGVVTGAVENGYADALGVKPDQLLIFPDAPSALEGLKSGRVDAYAGTRLTVASLLRKAGGGMESAQPFNEPVIDGHKARGYGAFGFRKEDKDFVKAFNEQLKGFVGSSDHLKLVSAFGFGPGDMPGPVTAEQLCHAPSAQEHIDG
ncbi:MAG TPA: ectoine/hydroxyectoine ABC transporter substrate-binding protein EhuB [Burkholderiaceae bacterium]